MNKTMRRKERKISDKEAFEILTKGEYGILSMCTPDNEGYGIPLNYVLCGDRIYFHCAVEGKKLDILKINNRVSFCVVGTTQLLPAEFGTVFESCIVSGPASIADGDEKREGLKQLVAKYSGDYIAEGDDYINKFYERVLVIKLSIESFSGKARRS